MSQFPEEWKITKIGSIANVLRGASPRPIDSPAWFDDASETGWLRISDVTAAGKYLHYTSQNLSYTGIFNSRFVSSDSLVMSICATVGRPIITKKDVCIHDGFVVFDQLKVNNEYFYYFLSNIESDWSKHGQTGSQMNLNTGLINSTYIPVPGSYEQTAIAKALSDVDGLLGALEALIAKKQAIKQAAMQQLLTGKTRLPGFSGEWETKRLEDIALFFKGSGNLLKADLSLDGNRRCIHYGELFTTYKECIDDVLHGTDLDESFSMSLTNDVLMPASDVTPNGLATASCILISDIILGGDILIIRAPKQTLNGVFLAYSIKINRNQIMQLVSGTTVFHLNATNLANFHLTFPNVEEQDEIVAVLSDMDSEIAALERRRDKTRAIKQGMMQQLLTGRVRLVKPE